MKISDELIKGVIVEFIQLGEKISHGHINDEYLECYKEHDFINRMRVDHFVRDISENELRYLIYAITICEAKFGWLGSSAAPVIFLFKHYANNYKDKADELSEWIVKNRGNNYIPYGTLNDCFAANLTKFQMLSAARLEQSRINSEIEEKRQSVAMANKREREQIKATENLFNAVRRNDVKAVAALLAKGGDPAKSIKNGVSAYQLAKDNALDAVLYLFSV
jgi:hypothetical protein